jgi:hypothetical protein
MTINRCHAKVSWSGRFEQPSLGHAARADQAEATRPGQARGRSSCQGPVTAKVHPA